MHKKAVPIDSNVDSLAGTFWRISADVVGQTWISQIKRASL